MDVSQSLVTQTNLVRQYALFLRVLLDFWDQSMAGVLQRLKILRRWELVCLLGFLLNLVQHTTGLQIVRFPWDSTNFPCRELSLYRFHPCVKSSNCSSRFIVLRISIYYADADNPTHLIDKSRIPKTLHTSHPSGPTPFLRTFSDETAEASFIAMEVKRVVAASGGMLNWNDFVVLRKCFPYLYGHTDV